MGSLEGIIIRKQQKMVRVFICLGVQVDKMVIKLNITAFKINKNKEILKWTLLNQVICLFQETKEQLLRVLEVILLKDIRYSYKIVTIFHRVWCLHFKLVLIKILLLIKKISSLELILDNKVVKTTNLQMIWKILIKLVNYWKTTNR